jgi:hypothetical protein
MKAGIRGGPSRLDTAGFPSNACLNWVCHPNSVADAAAMAVYKQIEMEIKRLLEMNKRPKQK